jgi:hypothetical protein
VELDQVGGSLSPPLVLHLRGQAISDLVAAVYSGICRIFVVVRSA